MVLKNLFVDIPANVPDEWIQTLASSSTARIEQIVSQGHASPEGFWFDQPQDEWVILLRGEARLLLEGESGPVRMTPGDHVLIPAHQRHRVEWTAPDEPTVWLAVHF